MIVQALIFVRRYWSMIGLGLLLLVLLWALHSRGWWKETAADRAVLLDDITKATREASGNKRIKWDTAAGQVIALGDSIRAMKQSIEAQNVAIDEMAAEAVRLKARATELKKIADKAQAQRAAALRRLSDLAITPGTRSDCLKLLKEADDALDLVRSAGA